MILLEVAVNLFTRTWFRIRSVTSARQACRKNAVLSLIRSQRQLACEGLYWVQNMDQNGRKLPCPKIRIFDHPAVIDFSQKMEVTVMAPNHGGDPLGSILGPMGSYWDQKMGQNLKKLPSPKIRIFQKSRWGPSRVHLRANGVPLGP